MKLAVLLLCGLGAVLGRADVLYSTAPPEQLVWGAPIHTIYATTAPFTLSQASAVTQVSYVGYYVKSSYPQPSSLDWEITTEPNSGVLYSGTGAQLTTGPIVFGASGTVQLEDVTFSLRNVNLAEGTYWLLLQNCQPESYGCEWNSSEFGDAETFIGNYYYEVAGTAVFTIYGTAAGPSSVPEPGSLPLLALGGLAIAARVGALSPLFRMLVAAIGGLGRREA